MKEFCTKYNITERQFKGIDVIHGSIDLSKCLELPNNINLIVEGSILLFNCTDISDNVKLTASISVILGSVKRIGENVMVISNKIITNIDINSRLPLRYPEIEGNFIFHRGIVLKIIGEIYDSYEVSFNGDKEYYIVGGFLYDKNFNELLSLK